MSPAGPVFNHGIPHRWQTRTWLGVAIMLLSCFALVLINLAVGIIGPGDSA